MKIKLPYYNLLTKIISILIFVLSTAQACQVTDVFYKSVISQTSNSASVVVKHSVWKVDGTAKVYVTPGTLQCADYCSFVQQNQQGLSLIRKCNISRDSSNNSIYNVNWTNLPSSANSPQLSIQCQIIDQDPVNYYKQQTYTFVFSNANSSQICNSSFKSAPTNMTNNLTITTNNSYADSSALYSFNFSTPSFQLYTKELYLRINYLPPVSDNLTVTYLTTKNQTFIENIKFLNNQSVFLVTNNFSIRPYIKNIKFELVYFNPNSSSQQNMTVNLIYSYNGRNYTIYYGQKQFNITYLPANLSCPTFDLVSIYANTQYFDIYFPISTRPNQPFSFDFNVTVNRSSCNQYNINEFYNLFDTMVVQLDPSEGLNFSSSSSVTILSNQSKQLNFTFKTQYNPFIKITIENVNLTEGFNRVFINGVQNIASTSLPRILVKCFKNNDQIKQLQFVLQINQSSTYVQQVNLYINQLNGSYPSRLNQPQQFDLNISLTTPLTTGDYVVIKIPSEYSFMQTNSIKQTDNISLCSANTNYRCFNGQNSTQIWVTGQFNNITSLIVSIDNNTYRSPRTWGPFKPFQVNTFFSAGYNKDVSGNLTQYKTFYLSCKDSQKKCRESDSSGNCLSCYDANDTQISYPYLDNGSCIGNCSTNCSTCSVYTSNCTSCETNYSLYSENKANFSCVKACPSSFVSINSVCKPCAIGCLSCTQSQSNCMSCNANYSLSLIDKKCYAQCPSSFFSQLSQGSLICASCSQGCKTCTNSTYCQNCSAGYFQQLYTANNSNICVKNCSAGRVFLNNNCNTMANQSSKNNSSNTTNQNSTHQSKSNSESTSVSSESSSFKILTALPCTILFLLSIIVAGGSKLIVPKTNILHLFTSASGVLQVVSWYLALSIFLANSSQSQTDFSQNAKIIISSALSLNFIINLIGFYFFKTNLFGDDIFYRHYFCLKNSMSARFYVFTTLMFVFMLTSNKIIEILFSNLFGIKCFSFRLQNYSQILRQNYLRYASFIPSLVALVASIMTMLSLQSISLSNSNLLTLIDLCIVTILGLAATIKIVFRNQSDYQKQQRADVIDINEQISNQPISDLHNIQQVKKSKHQTPSKSKSPIKAIILHCSRKKAEIAQSRHETQQHLKPYPERQIVCTDDHFQDKDIDQHSNQLNETRVTTKVYISKPKKALKEDNQHSLDYNQNNLQTKLTKIRSNRRQKQKVIKQFIGDENENLKHQVRSAFLPDQIKIMKQILNINDLYQKVIAPQQKELQRESEANLNNQNAPSTADKLHLLAKFKPADHEQLERETQLAIQQLDLAVDLMAYKNISLQKMFKYFELLQREESECQKENFCSNLSTPYVNNYFNNEVVLTKGSRNSRQTRKKTKKRRSQFRDGPKIFLENQNGDLSPYVADFYVHQEAQNDNCQLQKEEIDEQGNIDAAHCRQINQQPTSLMKIKPFSSLDNTAGSEIYVDFKKPNNENVDCVSKSQQIEASRPLTLNKIGSSVPLKKKIQADCGIPESCELDEDNVDYLQTDRYADTQMKLQELEEQNEHFEHNVVNRMQAEIIDRTPGKPKMAIIKSRILCGSQEITNQFKDAQQVSSIMSRYGARQLLTMNKKRLPSLGREGVGS